MFISKIRYTFLSTRLQTKAHPEMRKLKEIYAIYKSGEEQSMTDYRPIRLLLLVLKVLKKTHS